MKAFMKRKYGMFLSLFIALLISAGAVSCSNDINNPKNDETQKTEVSKGTISFKFSLPQGGGVVYNPAPLKSIHDQPEWNLSSLYMYVFDANTGNIVGAPKDIVASLHEVSGEEATWNYVHEYNPATDTGVYRFAFVANENPGAVQSETELLAKLASKQLQATGSTSKNLLDNEKDIPMTGYAFQGSPQMTDIALSSAVANAKVELTRIVARIDIKNIAKNFVITELSLQKTNDRSNLFVKKDAQGSPSYEAPSTAERVAIRGFADVPATGIEKDNELKKAFYLYEGPQPQDLSDYTAIEVKGTLSGKPIRFTVPFSRNEGAKAIPVTVKRNHIYRIVLGSVVETVEGAKVKFTIEDTPWNAIVLNDSYDAITIDTNFGNSYNVRWSPSHRVLITGTEYFSSEVHRITVRSNYKAHTTFNHEVTFPEGDPEWCDITYADFKSKTGGTFTIKKKNNLTVADIFAGGKKKVRVMITLWSDADPDYKITITNELRNINIPKDPNIIIDNPDEWPN